MKAKSIKGKTAEDTRLLLTESMADGFAPTLAFVFCSIDVDRMAVTGVLGEKGISVFGLTTNGEFIDEVTEKGTAAILLLEMPAGSFSILTDEYEKGNYHAVAAAAARKAATIYDRTAFIIGISDPAADGEEVLRGFEEVFGEEVNAFGGCAGDNYAFAETFVFTNHWQSNHGMIALVVNEDQIAISGIATCGWKAVGTERIVTKSVGNHVITIDDVPALDITTKYGGLENVTPENQDLLVELAANFPLQLQRPAGDPVMRPGLVVDWSDHSFYTSGSVPQGSTIRFSLPPDWDVMEKVVKGVQHMKDTKMPEADALLVFSCGGRILSFGPMMNAEIEGVKKVWNVPMAGMFSNAELGRMAGGNLEMHNLTTCAVAIKAIGT